MLWPLIYLGISSVFYWAYTESIGEGDLRFYAVIQFLPMVLIPLMVLMFPNRTYSSSHIWQIVSVYILAKFAEHFDYQIYELIGMSGHVFKHVIAAMAGAILISVLKSIRYSD